MSSKTVTGLRDLDIDSILVQEFIKFLNSTGSLTIGLNPPNVNLISTSAAGDSVIISSGDMYLGTTGGNETILVGKIGTTGKFQNAVYVENGPNPKFNGSNSNGEFDLGMVGIPNDFFTGTGPGDVALRSNKSLFIGPSSGVYSTFLYGNMHINNIPFKYTQGNWTPTLKYLSASGAITPPLTVTYDFQDGYYTRVGSLVTCFFDIGFSLDDGAIGAPRYFIAIGGIPVQIGVSAVVSFTKSNTTLVVGKFPNGLAAEVIPIIGVPTYTKLNATSYEQNATVPLFINAIANIDFGVWTSDGFHFPIWATSTVYTPALTVPPWSAISDTYTPLSDLHVTSNTFYSGCRFSGTITYMSDY